MKKLSYSKLIQFLKDSKGVLIVGILALCDSNARKTGNPYGKIFKQIRAVGFVGVNYGKAVEREQVRQEKEIDFVPDALPWGEWIVNHKLIGHNGEFYLRTQTTPGQRRTQAAKVICYRDANGKFLSRDDVKPFLPVAKESAKQQDKGLAETVWVRTYKFSSIQRIRINGETYLLAPDAPIVTIHKREIRATSANAENQVETKLATVSILETQPD